MIAWSKLISMKLICYVVHKYKIHYIIVKIFYNKGKVLFASFIKTHYFIFIYVEISVKFVMQSVQETNSSLYVFAHNIPINLH